MAIFGTFHFYFDLFIFFSLFLQVAQPRWLSHGGSTKASDGEVRFARTFAPQIPSVEPACDCDATAKSEEGENEMR